MAKYCNKNGDGITESEWRDLRKGYSYVNIAEYENERRRITLTWEGKVDERAHQMFWAPFSVTVYYGSGGEWSMDFDVKQFTTEGEAREYYINYLIENTDCEIDGYGNLVEVGNLAAERIAREKEAMKLKREVEAKLKAEVMKAAQAKREIEKEKIRQLAAEKKEREEWEAAQAERERVAKRGDNYGSW